MHIPPHGICPVDTLNRSQQRGKMMGCPPIIIVEECDVAAVREITQYAPQRTSVIRRMQSTMALRSRIAWIKKLHCAVRRPTFTCLCHEIERFFGFVHADQHMNAPLEVLRKNRIQSLFES